MDGLFLAAGALVGGRGGLLVALVVALAVNGYAYFNSDKLALRAMRAFPVTETQAPQLYAMGRDLATEARQPMPRDRKRTRLNSSHANILYAVFCLKKI